MNNYNELFNKPSIDGHELIGNMTVDQIGGVTAAEVTTALGNYYTKAEINAMIYLTPTDQEGKYGKLQLLYK